MPKLNQILAIEKDLKAKAERELTEVYRQIQKEELFQGRVASYHPYEENGQKEADQRQAVQVTGENILARITDARVRLYDIVFTKDKTNTVAKATVKVGDVVLLEDVPVSTLLYLEKQLVDLHTCVSKIPVLASDKAWKFDSNQNTFVTDAAKSFKMKKVPRTLVKAEPTQFHPAQVDVFHEDIQVGEWTTTHQSGALPAERKARVLERISQFREAVKFAREEANSTLTTDVTAGKKLFDFLFGG